MMAWLAGFSSYLVARIMELCLGQVLSNYGHFFINVVCAVISREECVGCVHIWYSNQVPCVADACKIAFVAVPNSSNYDHFFINVMFLL